MQRHSFHPKMESGRTNLHHIEGLYKKPYELKYDFSGDEFEVSNVVLRGVAGGNTTKKDKER